MTLRSELSEIANDAPALEQAYRHALEADQEGAFIAEIIALANEHPDNILLATWMARLEPAKAASRAARPRILWPVLVIVGLVMSVLFYFGLDDAVLELPSAQFWLPLAFVAVVAAGVSVYLVAARRRLWGWTALVLGVLVVLGAYAVLFMMRIEQGNQDSLLPLQYQDLAPVHFAGLAFLAVLWAVGGHHTAPGGRHAIIIKVFETAITIGLLQAVLTAAVLLWGTLFTIQGLPFLFFDADTPLWIKLRRFAAVTGVTFVVLLSTAFSYNAHTAPEEQDFSSGISIVVSFMLRILLLVSVVGLAAVAVVIPFTFMEPFNSRDVLIAYNMLQFAVVAVVVGIVPPLQAQDSLRTNKTVRAGVLILIILTVLVSLYALAAVVYRTALTGLTPNRITVITWNAVNIALLALAGWRILRTGKNGWVAAISRTIHVGLLVYTISATMLLVVLPLVFH
ncbi:MAG: hypothetical protein GXY52_00250 [Chloroflexi bacterium]|nr:hypothetical protein [Chloroflexota bacterium]